MTKREKRNYFPNNSISYFIIEIKYYRNKVSKIKRMDNRILSFFLTDFRDHQSIVFLCSVEK